MNIPGTRYEGPLERKMNKWKEYHVVLNKGQLLFYKDKTSDPRDGLLGTLKLSVTTFCNSSSGVLTRGYQFSVSTPDSEAYLRSNTAEQRDKWIKEIMGSVTELNEFSTRPLNDYNNRPSMSHPEPQVYDSTLVVSKSPDHEWYWPGKTRDQAEQLLRQVESNHFLVRDSGHEPGSYSLSVRVEAMNIFHYIIKRDHAENKFILVPEPAKRFDTLEHVVAYYLQLNNNVALKPLKNPAFKPQPAAPVYGNNATLASQSEAVPAMTYTDPATSGMTVNPHETGRRSAASSSEQPPEEKRRSVADILDEEFSKLESGDTRANSYKFAVTQNPTSHTAEGAGAAQGSKEGTENEYVRLGKFPSAKQQQQDPNSYEVDGGTGKAPVKPTRPSVSRQGTQSEYMNVTTQPPPQEVINSGPSNGGGNYIYAKVGTQGGGGGSVSSQESGDKIVIRGSKRSTPVVASFGDMGTPLNFSGRNGSTSLFEDSAPNSAGPAAPESSYVNCELNNQVNSVSISDPRPAAEDQNRPKSSGMSKSSAKAGKNKMAKAAAAKTHHSGTAPQYSYKNQYPPAATGPISYNDPCLSMTTPPTPKNKTAREEDLFPAPAGPIGYTDPAISMSTAPPSKSKSVHTISSQFPTAATGPIGYTDPSIAMSKPPPKIRGARHNGV